MRKGGAEATVRRKPGSKAATETPAATARDGDPASDSGSDGEAADLFAEIDGAKRGGESAAGAGVDDGGELVAGELERLGVPTRPVPAVLVMSQCTRPRGERARTIHDSAPQEACWRAWTHWKAKSSTRKRKRKASAPPPPPPHLRQRAAKPSRTLLRRAHALRLAVVRSVACWLVFYKVRRLVPDRAHVKSELHNMASATRVVQFSFFCAACYGTKAQNTHRAHADSLRARARRRGAARARRRRGVEPPTHTHRPIPFFTCGVTVEHLCGQVYVACQL